MQTAIYILFFCYLVIGITSILTIMGVYSAIVLKQRTVNAFFNIFKYATQRQLRLFKLGIIGFVIAVVIFIAIGLLGKIVPTNSETANMHFLLSTAV